MNLTKKQSRKFLIKKPEHNSNQKAIQKNI